MECFNLDLAIEAWYVDKNQRLNTGPHNCPLKRATISHGDDVIDMATLTLYDLEEHESDEEVDFNFEWSFSNFILTFLLCWDNFYIILFTVCC